MAFMMFNVFTFGQGNNWLWSKSINGVNDEQSPNIATDQTGNTIVTGWFYSPILTIGTTTLTNANNTGNSADFFIVKYDVNGNVLWAKSAGGTSHDQGYGVTTDADGNIIVSGHFTQTIIFGTDTLHSAGGMDVFITKYDPSGNVIWAKGFGGAGQENSFNVTTDLGGNIILAGHFTSDFITIGTTTLNNYGSNDSFCDIFLVKFDAAGNILWVKGAAGDSWDYIRSVKTDANGNIYIGGHFSSTSMTFGTTTLTNSGNNDIFFAKYASNGNLIWVKRAGGAASDDCYCVTADLSGNIIIAGAFKSSSITFGTNTLTTAGYSNMYLVKYDTSGNVQWAKSMGGNYIEIINGIATDNNGNIFLTGYSNRDSINFGTTTVTNNGGLDIFLFKYDAGGNEIRAEFIGGAEGDAGCGVATDANGNILITGDFRSPTVYFGTNSLNNAYTSVTRDVFIAKLNVFADIKEDSYTSSLKIFPNPFTSQAVLRSDNVLHDATLIFYNIYGQTIKKIYNISGKSVNIYRGNLKAGLYIIKMIQNKNIIATGKLEIMDL